MMKKGTKAKKKGVLCLSIQRGSKQANLRRDYIIPD